jgi:pyruvate ferredoxin oxidoreductase alpha subunit
MKKIEECSKAIAEAVRLARPGVIAAYPITPQTEIVQTFSTPKGGLILGPGNTVMPETPMANIEAMCRASEAIR